MAKKMGKNRIAASIDVPIILILVIILTIFLGSALLFWRLNTNILRSSVAAETNLSSSLLADDIDSTIPKDVLLSGAADNDLSDEFQVLEERIENTNDVWIVDSDGQIYYRNVSETGLLVHESDVKDIISSYLDESPQSNLSIRWVGKNSWFLLSQQCCIVRPLYDSSLFLVMVNHANSDRALQRRQFAMLMLIDVMLMLVMIVLVVNTSVKYRLEMIRFATMDELTGLANRKNFNTEFAQFTAREHMPPFSLFLLDIDYFKQINDSYGHAAGDHALSYLADQIKEMVSQHDGFAGRWGGDEFIGILPLSGEEALSALRTLCKKVEAAESEDGFKMTISAGVAFADKEVSLIKLTEIADLALYESKENGRNQASLYNPLRDAFNAIDASAAPGISATFDAADANHIGTSVDKRTAAKDIVAIDKQTAIDSRTAADSSTAINNRTAADSSTAINNRTAADNRTVIDSRTAADSSTAINNRTAADSSTAINNRTAADSSTGADNSTVIDRKTTIGNRTAVNNGNAVNKRFSFKKKIVGYVQNNLVRSTLLGVRWMAPFVAGGGILIALAFLFDAASVDLASLTVSERASFGSITSLAATLKNIGGITFNFMLPVFAGFMAYGIAGEDAFLTGFVGGYMTIDCNAGFIGAMIAGFAAGVITNEVGQFTGRLPKFIRKAAPIIIFPVFNLLLMQVVALMIITPISTAIGSLFSGLLTYCEQRSPVATGALSAMMMAFDMGGIINKVAYNYGVNGILAGHTNIMACVMIGGMVPPIGIALSVFLFQKQKKFTASEQDRALSALFMGLSFITEGALPYVFTDFLRVIPTCMLGSFVAGLLSALFGCALPAPHGGVFVLPIMSHPFLYLLALAIGSFLTAVTLGMWKKETLQKGAS